MLLKIEVQKNPPGFLIAMELDERGWSQKDFAAAIGVTKDALIDLIRGKTPLTIDLAHLIGKAFGTSEEVWVQMEEAFRSVEEHKGG
mgnify:CR=1 FL=1